MVYHTRSYDVYDLCLNVSKKKLTRLHLLNYKTTIYKSSDFGYILSK